MFQLQISDYCTHNGYAVRKVSVSSTYLYENNYLYIKGRQGSLSEMQLLIQPLYPMQFR